jgi:hypothetical protein
MKDKQGEKVWMFLFTNTFFAILLIYLGFKLLIAHKNLYFHPEANYDKLPELVSENYI